MTLLVLFSLLGVGLLAILFVVLSRPAPSAPEGSAESLLVAYHALNRLQQSLLATRTVEQIFCDSDSAFVGSIGSAEITSLFHSERRRLALYWVSEVRAQIISLLRFHRTQSGFYANISIREELSLIGGFWSLLLACRGLQLLIFFRGPFAARAFAARAVLAASGVCNVAGKPISFLNSYSSGLSASSYSKGQVTK